MTKREWMEKHKKKYKTFGDLAKACADATGCDRGGSTYRVAKEVLGEPLTESATGPRHKVKKASGFDLSGLRTTTQQPSPSQELKKKLYNLEEGKGFALKDLAKRFEVSEETLRKRAKQYDCFRYVEVGPGDWVSCIMHPDTASALSSK